METAEQVARLHRERRRAERIVTLERQAPSTVGGVALPAGPVGPVPAIPSDGGVPSAPAGEVVALVAEHLVAPSGTWVTFAGVTEPPRRIGFGFLDLPTDAVPLTLPAIYTVTLELDWHDLQGGAVEVWTGDDRATVYHSSRTSRRDVQVAVVERLTPLRVRLRHSGDGPSRVSVRATVALGHLVTDDVGDDEDVEVGGPALPGPPAAPAVVAGNEYDNAWLDVSWNAVPEAAGYRLRAVNVDTGVAVVLDVGEVTDARIEWLDAATIYDVTVAPSVAGRIGDASPATRATTPADTTAPGQVTGVQAAPTVGGTVILSWDAAPEPDVADGQGHYEYRLDDGAPVQTGATVATVRGLDAGTYTVTVRAVDASGNVGPWSDPVDVEVRGVGSDLLDPFAVLREHLAERAVGDWALDNGAVRDRHVGFYVGGRNLLHNSAFVAGWDGWQPDGTVDADLDDTHVYTGDQTLRIAGPGWVEQPGVRSVLPATVYTASAWVYATAPTAVGLRLNDGDTVSEVVVAHDGAGWQRLVGQVATGVASGPVTLSVGRDAAPAGGWYGGWTGSWTLDQTGTVWVDALQLEQGDVATAWAPQSTELLVDSIRAEHIVTAELAADLVLAEGLAANEAFIVKLGAEEAFIDELVANDAFMGRIAADEAFLAELTVDWAKIANVEIHDADIVDLSASKIESGELSAVLVTLGPGGVLRAGDASNGVVLDSTGLRMLSGGDTVVNLPSSGSEAVFSGTITASAVVGSSLSTATTGPRIEIDTSGIIRVVGGGALRFGTEPTSGGIRSTTTTGVDVESAGSRRSTLRVSGQPGSDGATVILAATDRLVASTAVFCGVPNPTFTGPSEVATGTTEGVVLSNSPWAAFRRADNPSLYVGRNSDGQVVQIRRSGNTVGDISVTTSSTSFNTSSDYRLKTDVADLDGAPDRLAAARPVRHRWVNDPDAEGVGFIAHELAEQFPQAVTGTKDEVDEDGEPVYQGVDASKLVPDLVAGWQHHQTLIDQLTARLETLEGAAP